MASERLRAIKTDQQRDPHSRLVLAGNVVQELRQTVGATAPLRSSHETECRGSVDAGVVHRQ